MLPGFSYVLVMPSGASSRYAPASDLLLELTGGAGTPVTPMDRLVTGTT